MIAATLFSGIGAPEVSMPAWQWPWHAEIDKFPSAVMNRRHPQSANLGDVTADDFSERAAGVARPDVLVFGSPCQSYSIAGKRLGLDDPRGNLALVALGIVARLKPRWFVFENVPGLLSSSEGRDFGLFLKAVDELGYSLAWAMLDAQFAGLAQRRDRVFAVGSLGDWRGPAAVLFEPESLCGHSPPSRQKGQGVAAPIASGSPGGSGYRNDPDTSESLIAPTLSVGERGVGDFELGGGMVAAFGGNDTRGPIEIATAVNSHGGPHGRLDFESETFVTAQDGTGRGTPLIPVAFSSKDHGADAGLIAPTLRAMPHDGSHANGGGQVAVAFNVTPSNSNKDYNARPSERAQALTGSGNRPSARGGDLISTSAVRRLTPRECERLQGFPDDFTLVDYRGKPASDGPRYKALGNSMAVPVLRWILSRIEFVDGLKP